MPHILVNSKHHPELQGPCSAAFQPGTRKKSMTLPWAAFEMEKSWRSHGRMLNAHTYENDSCIQGRSVFHICWMKTTLQSLQYYKKKALFFPSTGAEKGTKQRPCKQSCLELWKPFNYLITTSILCWNRIRNIKKVWFKNNIIVTFKVAIIHSSILIVQLVSACTVIERILNASMRVKRFYLLSYILPHPKNLLEPYYISVIVTLHGNMQK